MEIIHLIQKLKGFFFQAPYGQEIDYLNKYKESKEITYAYLNNINNLSLNDNEKEIIDNLAFNLQISLKSAPICYLHGFIIYSELKKYVEKISLNKNLTLFDIGSARGFSSILMAHALTSNKKNHRIHSFDIIGHNKKRFWNSIIDVKKGKTSRKEMLNIYHDLTQNIKFIEGKTNRTLKKYNYIERINFAFVDGSHEYEDVLFEYNFISERQKEYDIILFDDYNKIKFPGIVKVVNQILDEGTYRVKFVEGFQGRNYAICTKNK